MGGGQGNLQTMMDKIPFFNQLHKNTTAMFGPSSLLGTMIGRLTGTNKPPAGPSNTGPASPSNTSPTVGSAPGSFLSGVVNPLKPPGFGG